MLTLTENAASEIRNLVASVRANPNVDRDTGRAQRRVPAPGNFRIWILERRDHTSDPGFDDGIGGNVRIQFRRIGRLESLTAKLTLQTFGIAR